MNHHVHIGNRLGYPATCRKITPRPANMRVVARRAGEDTNLVAACQEQFNHPPTEMAGSTSDKDPAHHHSRPWIADNLNAKPPQHRCTSLTGALNSAWQKS